MISHKQNSTLSEVLHDLLYPTTWGIRDWRGLTDQRRDPSTQPTTK